jgi:hypothetical protein
VAFKGLTLAFLVTAEHQSLLRRIQIESDDIPEFGFEVLVVGEFESAGEMRLDVVGLPQAMDCGVGNSFGFGHGQGAPAAQAFGRTDGFVED